MSDELVVIIGYFIITILSLVIAARVRKHLSAFYAIFTHLFVMLLALYYGIDLLILHRKIFSDPYFYLWLAVIVTQAILLFLSWIKLNKSKWREKRSQSSL